MIAIGVVPLGALVDGAIAAVVGLRAMFALAGALCAALFLAIWFLRPSSGRSRGRKRKRVAKNRDSLK